MDVDGGTHFTLPSRPSNDASLDMGLPPHPSRLYGRSGRAALAAGTLGTVGDNTAREDVHGNVEVRDFDRYDADDMKHAVNYGDKPHERWTDGVNQGAVRAAFLQQEAIRASRPEAVRQARLRRWQTIR